MAPSPRNFTGLHRDHGQVGLDRSRGTGENFRPRLGRSSPLGPFFKQARVEGPGYNYNSVTSRTNHSRSCARGLPRSKIRKRGIFLSKVYVGHLAAHDPLHRYLRECILPEIGVVRREADFRVFSMQGSEVYLYEEKHSRIQLVGKFFVNGKRRGAAATERMWQEFYNLQTVRGFGLAGYPHHVVRPLGANDAINSILVEEYCRGVSLSVVINGAIHDRRCQELFAKLTALAYFLATLHNRSANGHLVDFLQDCAYLDRLVGKLRRKEMMSVPDADELSWLRDCWREQPRMWEDRQVLVHGDATPSNFLFGNDLAVMAIDLERMKRADRVFDVGRIAGELQHFFLQATGDKSAAEPFIGHFLWEYACHFPDRDRAFKSITARVPFQIGLTLLRIARNNWISAPHRRRLIHEAKMTLRAF